MKDMKDDLKTAAGGVADLVGNRWTYQQIAAVFGVTERSVYALVDQHKIPFIKVMNRRYVSPDDIRNAVTRDQANAPPRGPGRPAGRKAA
jgi:excisionase family DNA binding protein